VARLSVAIGVTRTFAGLGVGLQAIDELAQEEIMSRERSRFTPEFKEEAVRLVIEGSRPIAQVARQTCPMTICQDGGYRKSRLPQPR